jgi:hypothetical protein
MLKARGQQVARPSSPALPGFTEKMLAINDDIRNHTNTVNL